MGQLDAVKNPLMADRGVPSEAMESLYSALSAELGPSAVGRHEPLARYTSLRTGGRADLFVVAEDVSGLCIAIALAWRHGVPCRVLGRASNVLVSDAGIPGLVIINRAKGTTFSPTSVKAESGASISTLARRSVDRGLAGLEWATGIPGSVGGAVVGNAGAWGSNIASTLLRASMYVPPGQVVEWLASDFQYDYRASVLKRESKSVGQRITVLDAEFGLVSADPEQLQAKVMEITERRTASQPPGATCGSVFKNPPGGFAGRMIEAAGLKGQRIGQAEISPVHANFVVNHGSASAAEVKSLIQLAQRTVEARFGTRLELEIELIGRWKTPGTA